LNIYYTTQFKRDYKRIKKQNKDPNKLKVVIEKLVTSEKLEPKYRDHQLSGNWKGHRDCHIEPDWILIYRIEDEDLFLERTGFHSELFKK
jgi:mRNA interferase YafQ